MLKRIIPTLTFQSSGNRLVIDRRETGGPLGRPPAVGCRVRDIGEGRMRRPIAILVAALWSTAAASADYLGGDDGPGGGHCSKFTGPPGEASPEPASPL